MSLRSLVLFTMMLLAASIAHAAERGLEPVVAKTDANRKVALVVGNARYKVQPLVNAANDAKSMDSALKALGFEVITLTDAGRTGMVRALEDFKKRLGGSGVGLFYFAGHGIQMEGRNYLIPVDTDMGSEDQVKYNTIRLDDVMDTLAAGAPTVKIVILDACRNNPFERTRGGGGGLAAVSDAPQGTLIAFSTAPGKVAQDGKPGENGIYTSHLLKALQQPGLNIEDVFKATRASVARETAGRQLPWESTSLVGELVLRPGTPVPAKDGVQVATAQASAGMVTRGFERATRPENLTPGATFRDCERCPEMVVIPPGEFRMGARADEADRQANEAPQRAVRVARAFAAGKFEVTFDEWEACLLDGGCGYWPGDRGWGRGKRPVIDVSWEDANRYVVWLSRRSGRTYRLLTEAEWEYVARAGTSTTRPWGDALGAGNAACANCGNEDANKRTAAAGTFKPNAWGVADMLGNVWEWVADCRNASYEGAPADASAWLTGNCAQRAIRGGSWLTAAKGVRSAARGFYPAQRRDINIGFRVASDI